MIGNKTARSESKDMVQHRIDNYTRIVKEPHWSDSPRARALHDTLRRDEDFHLDRVVPRSDRSETSTARTAYYKEKQLPRGYQTWQRINPGFQTGSYLQRGDLPNLKRAAGFGVNTAFPPNRPQFENDKCIGQFTTIMDTCIKNNLAHPCSVNH